MSVTLVKTHPFHQHVSRVRGWCRSSEERLTVLGTASGSVYVLRVYPTGAFIEQLAGDSLSRITGLRWNERYLRITSISQCGDRLHLTVERAGVEYPVLLTRVLHDATV